MYLAVAIGPRPQEVCPDEAPAATPSFVRRPPRDTFEDQAGGIASAVGAVIAGLASG